MDEKIFFERTASGIPVIVDVIPDSENAVFAVGVGTGSRDEDSRICGISHLLEHVVFRGTTTRTSFQISKEIESAGGEMNAFTGKEMTAFYGATIKSTSDVAKNLVADIIMNPLIKEDDVSLEKEIVLQEISMWENDPESYIHKIFAETLWHGHELSKNEAGEAKVVESLKAKDLREYFTERYRRPNMAVFAAGATDPSDVMNWAETEFGGIKEGKKITRTTPGRTSRDYRFVERKGDHSYIGMGFSAYPADHKEASALSILTAILGAGMSSRLFQKVREEKALAYSVYCMVDQNSDAGSMAAYMSSTEKNVMDCIATTAQVCKELRDEGLVKGELERARNLIKGATARQSESTNNRLYRLIKRYMLTGSTETIGERMRKLDAVTEEDVMRVATDVITKELVVSVYGTNTSKMKKFDIGSIEI